VWPSAFLVSFKRNPAAARYDQVQNVESAKIVAYFMKKLNFTVNKAHLRFAGFSCNNAKGPPDRIIQSVKAFYTSQMKKKLFILLASTSIDEWRQLSGRDDGNDSYVEGDILRTTGNLAGRSAGFIVKKVGQGIGQGFAAGTAEVGLGIQNVTEAIGVGALGAGVNSFVSGIGEGVGSTVEGVGSGGNKLIQGAGKGVGQIVGGMGGGLQQVAMGFGRGVRTGDGGAILTGFGDGVTSIGTGVVRGTESVVTGAAEGVFSIGKGLFTGVTSLGKGVGRAVQGKKPKKKVDPRKASSEKRS
jgi:vacuolar protein sorting-associated protein 13A/C